MRLVKRKETCGRYRRNVEKGSGRLSYGNFPWRKILRGLINEYVKNGIIVEILKHLSETH